MRFTLHCTVALAVVLSQNASAHTVRMTPQQDLLEDTVTTETQLAQVSKPPSTLFWGTTVTGSMLASLLGYFVGSHTGTVLMEEKAGESIAEKDELINE